MDMTSENWENGISFPDAGEELEKMRKNLRKRNYRLVLTSVVLVIALLFSAVEILIPAVERQYWDPTACTYLEDITDLELTMTVYNELFGHGQHLMPPEVRKTGFASYSIQACFLQWETLNSLTDLSYRSAALTKGKLETEPQFWQEKPGGVFHQEQDYQDNDLLRLNMENARQKLQALPEYVQILASVTFPRDLSMKELQNLTARKFSDEILFLWAVLRTGDPEEGVSPACGILLTEYPSARYDPEHWAQTDYPDLFPARWNWTAKSMETHVISMLRFSAHQVERGTGIVPGWAGEDCYEKALAYVEENGVKTYGSYVITTPKLLLELLEKGTVCYVDLLDAWIGI